MAALVVTPILVALAGAAAVLGLGRSRPRLAAALSSAAAAMAFVAVLLAWLVGAPAVDRSWVPSWGARLALGLDGLGALYALLTTGIGLAVVAYAGPYMRRHLEHQHRAPGEAARFHALILLFMAAMLGLVMAQDLLLLFACWEVTTLASYLLIGYDGQEPAARAAALMALLVTGAGGVLLMAGVLALAGRAGSFAIADVLDPGSAAATAGPLALVVVAALAKSAQAPLHFWLPRAMVAPTPVSAYLHSAAMVAAGVFLLQRLHPLVATAPALLDVLRAVGAVSMVAGGVLALTADRLKPLLAYSTIAHYGYVTFTLGLGTEPAAAAAALYVLVHGVAKSALFLAAGVVAEVAGEDRLDALGGLGRAHPVLAASTAVAGATLAALPPTLGFFKDDLVLQAAVARGPLAVAVVVAGAALTLAYTSRFWSAIFLGQARAPAAGPRGRAPALLVAPVAVLAGLGLAGGLFTAPAERLAAAAGRVVAGGPVALELAWHPRAEHVLAALAVAAGAALVATRRRWEDALRRVAAAAGRIGPARFFESSLAGLRALSRRLMAIELRDLRGRLAAVLVPGAALVALALAAGSFRIDASPLAPDDWPLALALVLVMGTAIAATMPREHLAVALAVSAVGFVLAAVYTFFGAPDVALVAVLVETVMTLLLLGVLALLPRRLLARQVQRRRARSADWRDRLVAGLAGGAAFVVAVGTLSRPAPEPAAAEAHLALTPAAHGRDVVTVILADFRGLDTLGEITVVGIALVGVLTLLGRRRTR
jgi:multicomponent Na+:H+ antiporter subunit A